MDRVVGAGVALRVAEGVPGVGVAVGCGVGVAGALRVTISGCDSCGFWKESNARTRSR
jgi:hypothetical protein